MTNKTVFEIPISTVSNSNIAGKTEVSLEFLTNTTAEKTKKLAIPPDELVEMRFYVPGAGVRDEDDSDAEAKKAAIKEQKQKEKEAKGSGAEASDDDDNDDEDQSAAQQFHALIRERASLTSQTSAGALLVSFDDVLVTTPRGRYDIDMYQTFLRSVCCFQMINN